MRNLPPYRHITITETHKYHAWSMEGVISGGLQSRNWVKEKSVKYRCRQWQIGFLYMYSEVTNSRSQCSYNFHIILFKMKQKKRYKYTGHERWAFLYWSVKNIWGKTLADHLRNEIRNQALSRSRFSLIFDMLHSLFRCSVVGVKVVVE